MYHVESDLMDIFEGRTGFHHHHMIRLDDCVDWQTGSWALLFDGA